MKLKNYILISLMASSVLISCKKSYLDTKPSNAILPEDVYATIASLNSAITANYLATFNYAPVSGGGAMHDAYGQKSIDLANDLMGNDMVVHAQGFGWYNADYNYTAWTRPTGVNTRSAITWSFYYEIIKQANLLLDAYAGQTPSSEQQTILGEAYGLRAWAYFGLINNFQQTFKGNQNAKGVPLYTSSSAAKGRGTVAEVYAQIIKDLDLAETFLNGKPRPSKQRMDVSVVRGVRARVALVMEEWAIAADYANRARSGYLFMSNSVYSSRSGFSSITNPEWMWGAFIPADQSTIFASFFSHMDATNQGYATFGGQKKITKFLYDRIPAGDVRKAVFRAPGTGTSTIPDYTQTKFSVPTPGSWAADYLYMRIAEMYLIEAEALARLGRDVEAKVPLVALCKQRFPPYDATNLSGTDLLNEILLQRRIELWGEGFSLFDIKRNRTGLNRPTGPGNHGLPNLNPVVFIQPDASPLFLMRIPQSEIDNNSEMTAGDQNP